MNGASVYEASVNVANKRDDCGLPAGEVTAYVRAVGFIEERNVKIEHQEFGNVETSIS